MVRKNKTARTITLVVGVVLLMAVVVFLVGKSLAAFDYGKQSDSVNVATVKGLKVSILSSDDDALNLAGAYPQYDSQGLNNTPFSFNVTNTGSRPFNVTLKIENDTEKQSECYVDQAETIPCTALSTNYVRYAYSINDGAYSTPANLGANSNIVLTRDFAANSTTKVSIKLWIDKDAPNSIQGNAFFGKLILDGEQVASSS